MKEGMSYFTDTHLTAIGLLIFFVWFVVMCVWVLKIIPKEQHLLMAQMPLKDEEAT